jgi:hypothetical protein
MILSEEQIKKYIFQPKNEGLIDYLIKEKKKHELHIVGYGIEDFVDTVDGIEDKNYKDIKLKFANYKTVQIYHKTLKQISKIFTAKGGSVLYDTENEKVEENIHKFLKSKIGNQYNLEEWQEKVWSTQVNVDPMGMTFIELDKDAKPYLTYLSVYQRHGKRIYKQIHDFDYSDITNVEYIILYWDKDEHKNQIYRVIDDQNDYLVWQNAQDLEDVRIIEDEIKPNLFGKVPAVINSNRLDNKLHEAKTTYVKESLISAQDYLNDYIDYRIFKKKISIPRIWEFKTACTKCDGVGKIKSLNANRSGQEPVICPSCNGRGEEPERSLTDIFKIDLIEGNFQSYIPPTGSVTLPPAIQTQMTDELAVLETDINETVWGQGVFIDNNRANITAFEISIRNEQKTSQLREISRNEVIVREGLINLVGKYLFGANFKGVIIKPPTEFLLTTGAEAQKIYLDSKNEGAANNMLNKLYNDYLESEFENNPQLLSKNKKLFTVEPFPHNTLLEIKDIANEIEFTIKKNFEKYIVRYEQKYKRIYLKENTVEKIANQFYEWAIEEIELNKNINNESTSEAPE